MRYLFFLDVCLIAGKTIFICRHILPIVEKLYNRIVIINRRMLIVLSTIEESITQTEPKSLGEAFIDITGDLDEKEPLTWKEIRST